VRFALKILQNVFLVTKEEDWVFQGDGKTFSVVKPNNHNPPGV